jgi:uncharacterized membrane protein
LYQDRNLLTIVAAVAGAVKLLLSAFGIDIPNETADAIVNGVAALVAVVGIFKTHIKKPAAPIHIP